MRACVLPLQKLCTQLGVLRQWLVYWLVFSLLQILETFLWPVLQWCGRDACANFRLRQCWRLLTGLLCLQAASLPPAEGCTSGVAGMPTRSSKLRILHRCRLSSHLCRLPGDAAVPWRQVLLHPCPHAWPLCYYPAL